MEQVVIPGTALAVSRFVFGTSGLFNAGSAKARRDLLEAAAAHGFTHFDTAPYYGFGTAERDLRPVLAADGALTVTTKVGLYPPGGCDQARPVILARKAGGRLIPVLSRPHADWAVARARASLEGSLRRLGRERVDLVLLHEPEQALLATHEWARWLDAEVAAGRVGHYGIAPDTRRLASFAPMTGPLCAVVQTADSLAGREADLLLEHGRPLQLTYGYVSSAKRRGGAFDAAAVLAAALRRNASGAVVVGTGRRERLGQYARMAGGRHDP